MKITKKQKKAAAGVGAGLAALAAAAAGVYFLSKEKNRKKVKSMATAAKREIIKKIGQLKKVNQETYNNVIDQVAKIYGQMTDVNKSEILQMAQELKGHWDSISKSLAKKATAGKKKTAKKRVVKKKR